VRIEYRIDKHEHVVYLTAEGEITYDCWEQTVLSILNDPEFEPGLNFLSDRLHVTRVPETGDIQLTAGFFKRNSHRFGRCCWACVTPQSAAAYGMARMLAVLSRPSTVNFDVFTEVDEARQWLRNCGPDGEPLAA
jgi:hypothetical protein